MKVKVLLIAFPLTGAFVMETFWIVSLGNGRASSALTTWVDVCTWLEDEASQFLKTDGTLDFRKVNIRQHKRKALPERLKELESDEKDLLSRLDRVRQHKAELTNTA